MAYASRSTADGRRTERPRRRFGRLWRWITRIGLTLVILVLMAVAGLLTYRNIAGRQWADETAPQGPNRIEELFSVRIHDTQEWILLRGHDRHRPAILYLSGGPGEPGIGSARPVGVWTGLEREMVVATWDQPNTGKSEDLPSSQRHISRYIEDACEVARVITQRLGTDRVYVLGGSWGSFLGVLTTAQCSERIAGFFGMGQLISAEQADETAHFLLRDEAVRRHDSEAIKTLDGLGPPPWTRDQVVRQHSVSAKYGGVSRRYRNPPPPKVFLAPEMSTWDGIWSFPRGRSIGEALWPELHRTDLNTLAPELEVPVFFLIGRFDTVTPPTVSRRYFDHLSAPRKEWIWFDHSAHIVGLDEPERLGVVITSRVREIEKRRGARFATQSQR